jgi:hypothetical protein
MRLTPKINQGIEIYRKILVTVTPLSSPLPKLSLRLRRWVQYIKVERFFIIRETTRARTYQEIITTNCHSWPDLPKKKNLAVGLPHDEFWYQSLIRTRVASKRQTAVTKSFTVILMIQTAYQFVIMSPWEWFIYHFHLSFSLPLP